MDTDGKEFLGEVDKIRSYRMGFAISGNLKAFDSQQKM
jgi:hypothetical protein